MGLAAQGGKGRGVQVVKMAVGDEDVIRLRHHFEIKGEGGEVLDPEKGSEDRIDQQVLVQVLDHHRGVLQKGDRTSFMSPHRRPIDPDGAYPVLIIQALEGVPAQQLPPQEAPQAVVLPLGKGI